MAKKVIGKAAKAGNIKKEKLPEAFHIYWGKENTIILSVGFVLLFVGFYLLSVGKWDSKEALVFAPVLLIFAYVVVFPLSILFRRKKNTTASTVKVE